MNVEIDHVAISVVSLEQSLPLFRDLLQMPVNGFEEIVAEQVQVAMIQSGGDFRAPRIELLESTAESSAVARSIESRGPGLHHIALRVDDLADSVKKLASAGYRILGEPKQGAGGHLYVFVHPGSTGGILLELVQRTHSEKGEI